MKAIGTKKKEKSVLIFFLDLGVYFVFLSWNRVRPRSPLSLSLSLSLSQKR